MVEQKEVDVNPPSVTQMRREIIGVDDRLEDIVETCPLWTKLIPSNLAKLGIEKEGGVLKTDSVFWQFWFDYKEIILDLARDYEGGKRIEITQERYADLIEAEKELFEKTLTWMLHFLNKKTINYPKVYPQLQQIRKDARPLKKKEYKWVIELEGDYQPLLERCGEVYDLYRSNRRSSWLWWGMGILALVIGAFLVGKFL